MYNGFCPLKLMFSKYFFVIFSLIPLSITFVDAMLVLSFFHASPSACATCRTWLDLALNCLRLPFRHGGWQAGEVKESERPGSWVFWGMRKIRPLLSAWKRAVHSTASTAARARARPALSSPHTRGTSSRLSGLDPYAASRGSSPSVFTSNTQVVASIDPASPVSLRTAGFISVGLHSSITGEPSSSPCVSPQQEARAGGRSVN